MPETKKDDRPPLCYIMLVRPYINGVILPGFENAEIYPGEPIQVRGTDGLQYDHAVKLVQNSGFVWCNSEGGMLEVEDMPAPTEAEAATIARTGADTPRGTARTVYPEYHKIDEKYSGPAVLVEPAQTTDTAPPPALANPLPVLRRSSGRRDANGDERDPEPVPAVTEPVKGAGE